MISLYYTLDDDLNPRPCPDMVRYHQWHDSLPETSEWYSGKTGLGFVVGLDEVGDRRVSTVFMGIDHGFGEGPVLWETMIFPEAELCGRYGSHSEAVEGHRLAVEKARSEAAE